MVLKKYLLFLENLLNLFFFIIGYQNGSNKKEIIFILLKNK